MIWIPEQLIGAVLGSEVTLTCTTEAYPVSINYWTKDDEEALLASDKYEIINKETGYKVHMILRIKYFGSNDYGKYRCFARNALGNQSFWLIHLVSSFHFGKFFPFWTLKILVTPGHFSQIFLSTLSSANCFANNFADSSDSADSGREMSIFLAFKMPANIFETKIFLPFKRFHRRIDPDLW